MKAKKLPLNTCLLLGATVFLSTAGLGEGTFQTGVGIHLGRPNDSVQAALAAIQSTQLTFRGDAYWSTIETSKGVLSWPSTLDDLDILVNAMAARKLRPILVLGYGNNFYDGGTQPFSQDGISAYVRYALYVVEHFRSRVDQFEVWNEWSFGAGAQGGAGKKGDAIQYTNLLRATYRAIKAVRPEVVVLGGGSGVDAKQSAWVTEFIAAGGLRSLDGFSVHPYVHCDGAVKGSGGTPEEAIARIDTLHSQLDMSMPGNPLPVYVTEIGWPTSSGQCGIPQFAAAAYLQRFFLQARARPWIAGVWWYDLFDDGNDDSNREHRFGLFTNAGRAKLAVTGLHTVLRLMNSSSISVENSKDQYVIDGRDSHGLQWYAAWIPTNDFDAHMPWPVGSKLRSEGYRMLSGGLANSSRDLSAVPVILEHP